MRTRNNNLNNANPNPNLALLKSWEARSPICCGGVQSFQRTHDQTPLPRGKGARDSLLSSRPIGQGVFTFSSFLTHSLSLGSAIWRNEIDMVGLTSTIVLSHFNITLTSFIIYVAVATFSHLHPFFLIGQEKSEAQVLEGKSACSCLLVDEWIINTWTLFRAFTDNYASAWLLHAMMKREI